MQRWHEDSRIARRRLRQHRSRQIEVKLDRGRFDVDPFVADRARDEQVGRFRKMDPFDCGRAGCFYCHGNRKSPKRLKTRKERRFILSAREQIAAL